MPPNLQSGSRYLVGRQGDVRLLFSLCLSCAFLAALILVLSVRAVLPFYLYTPSVAKFSVSTAAHYHNWLQESPSVETLRLPDDVKVVYRENESHLVGNQERKDAGEGGVNAAERTKEVVKILYANVGGRRDVADVHVPKVAGEGSPLVLPSDGGFDVGIQWRTADGLSQPENAESNRHKSVRRIKRPPAAAPSTGREDISKADLFNWQGELEGVDLRESLQNLSSQERRVWLKLNWANFKILQADSISERFTQRLNAFFHEPEYFGEQQTRDERLGAGSGSMLGHESEGGRKRDCKLRFFMTWIASVSSFELRERMCVESIFTFHPTACVVILSRSLDTDEGKAVLQHFVNRGLHILAVSPDLPFLFRDTAASEWFKRLESGTQDPGAVSFSQNLSNILRMAVLYKYGGIYLDNDVLLLRDFSGLQNMLGAQSVNRSTGEWTRLNNAVMIFEEKSPVLFQFIQEFALSYNGRKWGYNGPYLVTRVIRRLIGCAGYKFSVASPAAFYPVNWGNIQSFFLAPNSEEERQWQLAKLGQLEKESYAVHLWNKASRNMDVQKDSIMDMLFQKSVGFGWGKS